MNFLTASVLKKSSDSMLQQKIQRQVQLSPYISHILSSPDAGSYLIATGDGLTLLNAETLQTLSNLPVTDATQVRFDDLGIWFSTREGLGLYDYRSGRIVKSWNCMSIVKCIMTLG